MNETTKYSINGRIIDSKTKRGVLGLRSRGLDKDLKFDDYLGQAHTGQGGRFQLHFVLLASPTQPLTRSRMSSSAFLLRIG